MLSKLGSLVGRSGGARSSSSEKLTRQALQLRKADYTSNDIHIPSSFLAGPPAKPVAVRSIDFASSPLPQYTGLVALVLDHVLSRDECRDLLALAEASVPIPADGGSPWRPALVSAGPGVEGPAPGYRESDRIIWDQQAVANRIWERCTGAEGLRELLATVPAQSRDDTGRWEFRRLNERMRFLKYSPGQYFKPHCDGPYWYTKGGTEFMTHYTVHVYLNDSAESDPNADLTGGATSFLSRDRKSRLDVDPKAGSVLIFQHSRLLHEGAEVKTGTKFTMRTDIIYELVPDSRNEAIPSPDKEEKSGPVL